MAPLKDKLALVTGGAKNVGKAIARELGVRGAHVLINYFHSPDEAKQTKAELEAEGIKVDLFRASVARQDQVGRMFAEIEARFGHLDILVNNAANGALLPLGDITDDHLDKAIDTNYKGGLRCARAAAPLMAKRGGGSIITISALGSSEMVMAGYLACAPAKAAAEAVTRYLAVEFAPMNIRVNTASAAMLQGPVADAFPRADEMQDVIRASTPMGRLGTPEELATVVAFLASDDSRWITGQVILADGGLSLGASLLSPRPRVTVRETDEIAVVGMGMAVAGANSPSEFWDLRTEGADLFVPAPPDRWDRTSFWSPDASAEDKSYQDTFVFMTGFEPEPEARDEPELTTKWLRHSLAQAMRGVHRGEHDRFAFLVGYTPDGSQHLEEAGVLLGMQRRLREVAAAAGVSDLSAVDSVLAERYERGAHDPARFMPDQVGRRAMDGLLPDDTELQMVDTACSSSLYAIDIGIKGLLTGKHDIAVCGGGFALTPRATVMFAKLHGLSRSGSVRAMDSGADGVLFADGAGLVVLKRLSRARQDGDRVLAVLPSFGSSSDGKGTAIYAPNSAGQDLAVQRALSGADAGEVDWVLAHATGTPAGDLAEFNTLREHFGDGRPRQLTSNKSLIGHTGWAAGVVSVIEVVLGIQQQRIPGQFRFTAPNPEFRIDETQLQIPTDPVAWPARPDRPRAAAVSGFGFGGTNAHMIVREYRATDEPAPAPPQKPAGRVVIVGWSVRVPGLSSRTEIEQWITGERPGPADSFGATYPPPPFQQIRLPPATVRMMDRCQLMMVECAHELRAQMPELWDENAATTGVFVGNSGPTRAGMLLANRSYLDDVTTTLQRDPRTAGLPGLPKLLDGLREAVRAEIPQSNEDSFPGMMPNIISARVANHFDLKGPNITLDSGLSSAFTAIDTAGRYLRSGELRLALAAGVNGNSLPEFEALLGTNGGLAEGAFVFALTMEETAVEAGLPALAYVDELAATTDPAFARYVGAAGGLAVLNALLRGDGPGMLPAQFADREEFAPGRRPVVRRHVPVLRAVPATGQRERTPFLPPGVVVLTDMPDLGADLRHLPADATVLSTAKVDVTRQGWVHLPEVTPDAVQQCLASREGPVRHVRIVTDLARSGPEGAESTIALHDAAFLTLQAAAADLSSVVALVLGSLPGGVPHPLTGLFSGLLKCADLELDSCLTFGLFTSSRDTRSGALRAERESVADRSFPVVFDDDGTRRVPTLVDEPVELPEKPVAVLDSNSVVLAVGGARGITAEVVKAIARHFASRIFLVGSNPLDSDLSHGELPDGDRKAFIRRQVAAGTGRTVAQLNRDFDRILNARAARANIAEMEAHSGLGRVTYLACDIADEDAVQATVEKVLAEVGKVDLLINAAGRNHSALIRTKDFAEFTGIRDLKLRGYRNLKKAFAVQPPDTWCNFGSLLGFFGQLGESDYASGNDFLASAAGFEAAHGKSEYTIGWTFWDGAGMVGQEGSLANAHYKRGGAYSEMSVAEGVHHFMQELHAARRHPSVVHLGHAEKRTVDTLYPGYLSSVDDGYFYLGRPVSQTEHSATFELCLDLEMHDYLTHHLVRGVPTLPGAFVAEIAAEAALHMVPGMTVTGFEEMRFHHFLKVYPDVAGAPRRVVASVVDSGTVEVRIVEDVISPGGVVLVRDRVLFTTWVLLADAFPARPEWQPWDSSDNDVPAEDPYHSDDTPVRLTGPFESTANIRRQPGRARATFHANLAPGDPVWSAFVVPPILLDGLIRTAVLAGDATSTMVPTSIGRIELYEKGNDIDLTTAYGRLGLYASGDGHLVATAPDGRVVARILDVQATPIDF